MKPASSLRHRSERGQTIALVAVSVLTLLGIAALAIDVTTLYVARTEAQRAADAGALGGARVFVTSGFTSGLLGPISSGSTQAIVCNGNGSAVGSGLADQQAQNVAQQNIIAGTNAAVQSTACNFSNAGGSGQNPQITVTIRQTGLPTFFSRIWNVIPSSVSASATAEAFNPSGLSPPIPIQVGSVKPWGIPNCDPNNIVPTNTSCSNGSPGAPQAGYFVDPTANYAIANPSTVVGQVLDLQETTPVPPLNPIQNGSPGVVDFLALDLRPATMSPLSCPSSGATSCASVGSGTTPTYFDTVACSSSITYSCGQTLNIDPNSGNGSLPTQQATLCLTHASTRGYSPNGFGQDLFCNHGFTPNCPHGTPINIDGGTNNPDAPLRGVANISRSDSVITVPIWDPCPFWGTGVGCGSTVTVVGFMQLGIARIRLRSSNNVRAIVMNIAGCGSASGTGVASGGGLSPIPVRLVK